MRSHTLLFLFCAVSAAGAAWEPLGPFGGSAAIVVVDRHRPETVLAATSNAQIFQSENSGDLWTPLPFPAQFRATLHALAVDHQNPGVYFVGLSSETPEYSGILRTSDGGLTWNRIAVPELRAVWSIAIWQRDSKVMAAGTEGGVFLTRDAGATWALVTPSDTTELKPVVSLKFDPWDSMILYAGTPHLAWKSADGGSTWQPIHKGMSNDSDVFSIVVDDRQRSRIFAATCGGIYRSVNGGAAWTRLTEPKGASYRTYNIAQDSLQPNVLLAGTTLGLVKSEDSGNTWRKVSEQPTRWIAFDSARPNRVFLATDKMGLLRSDDGGESFVAINRGFTNLRVSSVVDIENRLYITSLNGVSSSVLRLESDSESDWEYVPEITAIEGPTIQNLVTTADGELLSATSHGLARSRDAGLSWQLVPGPLEGTTISALYRHPTRSGILLASLFGGLFQSRDQGRTWALLAAGEYPNDFVTLLVLSDDPDRLYALSPSRGVYAITLPPE